MRRIRHACELLVHTTLTIREVGGAVWFYGICLVYHQFS